MPEYTEEELKEIRRLDEAAYYGNRANEYPRDGFSPRKPLAAIDPCQPESWVVEFRHPHFKWLDYDRRYATKLDALDAMKSKGTAYPLRVRREM